MTRKLTLGRPMLSGRNRTRKVVAWCVMDFGGEWEDAWEYPVRAFTDFEKAQACKSIREHRRVNPGCGNFFLDDYAGSRIEKIEVVIDE